MWRPFRGLAATLLTLLDGIDAGRWDSFPKGDPPEKKVRRICLEWIDLYPFCMHIYDMLRCVEVYYVEVILVTYAHKMHITTYYIYYMNIIFHMLHGGRHFRRDLQSRWDFAFQRLKEMEQKHIMLLDNAHVQYAYTHAKVQAYI